MVDVTHKESWLEKNEIKYAVETLASSFMEDQLCCWLFEEKSSRYQYLQEYFLFRLRYGYEFGEVHKTSNNFEGIAIWLPGDKAEVTYRRGLPTGGFRFIFKMGVEKMKKLTIISDYAAEIRNSVIQPPYMELSPIGVKPEYQGKGFGSKLLRPMMQRFDDEETICFLETQNPENIPIYEKLGFEIAKEGIVPECDLHHWGMMRTPE